jgi:hypothetical protein
MLPLATPADGELINLSQIVKIMLHKAGRCDECTEFVATGSIDSTAMNPKPIVHIVGEPVPCTVYFSDGRREIFDGQRSQLLNAEMHFLLNTYRQMQQQATSAIITPDATPRVM